MYVYRFIDTQNKILYIGKTVNMQNRMKSHFTKGHLPLHCYQSVAKIEYMKFKTEADSLIAETYFINLYKPPFNKMNKATRSGNASIVKIEPKFKLYKQIKATQENESRCKLVRTMFRLSFWGYIAYHCYKFFI